MATVTCRCPQCEQTFRAELTHAHPLRCAQCGAMINARPPDPAQRLEGCVVCPSRELFVRKDFPQRLGLSIVVAGFVASSVAWYQHRVIATFAILFGTALVDLLLYFWTGNLLQCYRCNAQYQGVAELDSHAAFDLEVQERYRQQAARLRERAGDVGP